MERNYGAATKRGFTTQNSAQEAAASHLTMFVFGPFKQPFHLQTLGKQTFPDNHQSAKTCKQPHSENTAGVKINEESKKEG